MKHLIVSFKYRNSIYAFAKILRTNGIAVNIINTPRSIAISCGLSLKTEMKYFSVISTLIRQTKLDGFVGIFSEKKLNSLTHFERLF